MKLIIFLLTACVFPLEAALAQNSTTPVLTTPTPATPAPTSAKPAATSAQAPITPTIKGPPAPVHPKKTFPADVIEGHMPDGPNSHPGTFKEDSKKPAPKAINTEVDKAK